MDVILIDCYGTYSEMMAFSKLFTESIFYLKEGVMGSNGARGFNAERDGILFDCLFHGMVW